MIIKLQFEVEAGVNAVSNLASTKFDFYCNSDALQRVDKWQDRLRAVSNISDPDATTEMLRKMFYPRRKGELKLGSRWVRYFDDFYFESAWYPPLVLQDRLLKMLIPYDRSAIVEARYEVDGGVQGYRFLALQPDGETADWCRDEIQAHQLSKDEHGEIYFDFGNDDGSEDMLENPRNLKAYYRKRLKNVKKLAFLLKLDNKRFREKIGLIEQKTKGAYVVGHMVGGVKRWIA